MPDPFLSADPRWTGKRGKGTTGPGEGGERRRERDGKRQIRASFGGRADGLADGLSVDVL